MNVHLTRHRYSSYTLLGLVIGLLLFLSNCGSETAEKTTQPDPGTPPSLSDKQTEQLVQLTEQQAKDLNIQLYTVESENISFDINAPGQVYAAPGRISVVSSPINGRVSNIYVHEGERVQKGDPLLEIESLEFANLVGDYLEATAEITYQQQQVERLKVLTEDKISPQRTLERAQADLRRAKTKQSASLARLRAVGISREEVQNWDPFATDPKAELTLRAPISGVLNQHLIDLGEAVNAYDKLLDIIDNTEVLVRGFVSPADAPFVREGTSVVITEKTEDGTPQGKRIEGQVTSVNPALDEENRSIVLNSIVPTEEGWPIVGQSVRMKYAAQPLDSTFTIPLSAIQFEEQEAAVFVQQAPREYVKRVVQIERMTEDRAVIGAGLKPGEKIAVTQVFSLKALERFEQFAD
ncbi:membrane fusion protein, cobalt-zinc-cadmium efflux system [Fodinibius salinus]|uniref:Membrane fusion protein, cobalt-zinc-cadmium efflux system n=1 Tax=Fodinibius salinus TaxID=860790 RepID=A0A5D3YJI7_9BACT|nr:efflux RND transporter periplasmic adaptor subunit [Fodinibius salinus]TYP93610.1 membrane fusion protein, cobalt-zinc-cadmium efflux system [Fodinibius salinus]